MKKSQVIRAWKDEEYRLSLSAEERASLPDHPAGILDVEDDVLRSISGGCCPPDTPQTLCSAVCVCITTPEFSCVGGTVGFC